MDYYLSIEEGSFSKHPEFKRLTCPGEAVIYENRGLKGVKENSAFYVGKGDDERHYFLCSSHELDYVVSELLKSSPDAEVAIRIKTKDNLPKNLSKAYRTLFDGLIKKGK